MRRWMIAVWLGIGCALAWARPVSADDRDDLFESKIRPVLAGVCFRCHSESKASGGLRVDSVEALRRGGDSGASIVPGRPAASLLIQAIQRQPDVSAMPPEKGQALRPDQVADFVRWIEWGAIWPNAASRLSGTGHWAFQPVRDTGPPPIQDQKWPQTSIDAYIRATQESAGVQPTKKADKLTLIRRATFDLTGLPPTPYEVDAFLHDESPQAFDAVIDRLLASPAYGERWGRHWLDVVRYADTAGETADYPLPLAWRYRNYVIDAFNSDRPYDEFLREQIAGDILARQGPPELYRQRVTATGYLAISRRFGFDSENYHHLTIQDTIDTLGQSVLGLSLGCARCHDHKFDPVSMRDYYALYGIFDSSRYAFPGSEQKQKVRAMVPLVPPAESLPKWRKFEQEVAAISARLAQSKRPVPAAVLRSLDDLDGDFELQAPAAGGSNGVLVPPWLYQGRIAVTTAAQSPFRNVYPSGRVGVSIAAELPPYRIAQAVHLDRDAEPHVLHVNLDFRIGSSDTASQRSHRFALCDTRGNSALEVLIGGESVALRTTGEAAKRLAPIPANQWQNLQLAVDLANHKVSGTVGAPGATVQFTHQEPVSRDVPMELIVLDTHGDSNDPPPAIEYDNLALGTADIPPVTTESPTGVTDSVDSDLAAVAEQLQSLTGIDGDFELQTEGASPVSPWNPGPHSVVKLAADSQSPFTNHYAPGTLGIHLPNRGEYDGFGLTLPAAKPAADGRLFASFDFRCASQQAGGQGSWRFYLGHGPGLSAAVELFMNGSEFYRRSGDARESVAPLAIGQWYQVQLVLDLPAKRYTGILASPATKTEFSGTLASGWDGTIDYSFIDSYGHIGGIRPALDADNFVLGDQPLPPLDAPPKSAQEAATRRRQVAELRRKRASLESAIDRQAQHLRTLLAEGPVPLAYGMAEGTPHSAHVHRRGEPDQAGEEVPRGFLAVLGSAALPADVPGSGRRELAQWLTRPDNPLTARVMANRIWQHHMGRGLVRTPNDFGLRGLPPTHGELLDHLAVEFMRSGWSVKSLHRRIMRSATYQQSSEGYDGAGANGDLYVGFPRRRLAAEEIRDAVLAVSGQLDRTPGGEHPFPPPTDWGFSQHAPFSAMYDHQRRSVYLMTQRLKRHPLLALFDGADPNASTADRLETTVPTQALFFLNDPLIHTSAAAWAERLCAARVDDAGRIELAWQQAFGRRPSEDERAEAMDFLTVYGNELSPDIRQQTVPMALAAYLRTIFASNEFLHVD